MALFEGAALAAALAALGIILIVGIITLAVIRERLKNKDMFKAHIKKQSETLGVTVIHIDLEDSYGNSIDEVKLASVDGANVTTGTVIYKSEL